jgi:hypothetical protein
MLLANAEGTPPDTVAVWNEDVIERPVETKKSQGLCFCILHFFLYSRDESTTGLSSVDPKLKDVGEFSKSVEIEIPSPPKQVSSIAFGFFRY